MDVPYFNLTEQFAALRPQVQDSLDRIWRTSAFVLGEDVATFEEEFAAYCDAKHCVALNTGTSALHLAMLAAGVGPGDEVITTANTFIATAWAITYTGATPVFADIDPTTGNLDPACVEAAVTVRTKAIMPVHLYGRPVDVGSLLEIARRHELAFVEDVAQAHGARYKGRRVGTFGQSAGFSFYPTKNLGGCGEGGALVSNDSRVADLARVLRDHGQTSRYVHEYIGYNYRMDTLQGAVLRIKLRHLEQWTARRRAVAARYRELLSGARADLPEDRPDVESVYHLFVVWVDDRDRVRNELAARGVQTAVHYPVPVHLQKAYGHLGYTIGSLPHTERACQRVISMPMYPEISDTQVEYAATALAQIVGLA
jgi:dTDP-4-amino-4,6-dideoxygalactose transaminase